MIVNIKKSRMCSGVFENAGSLLCVILISTLFTAAAFGQAADGNLVGSVLDASGAAVPNAKVEIENVDGSRRSAHCIHPRGSFENPLSRGEVEDKLRAYANGLLADAAIEEVIGMVATLEDLPSVRSLMDLLRAPPRRVQAA